MYEEILESLKGGLTPSRERALMEWRRAAAENEREYQQVVRLWDLRRVYEPALRAADVPPVEEILDRAAATAIASRPATRRGPRRFLPLGLAAAAAAVMIGVSLFALRASDSLTLGTTDTGVAELVTNDAEMVTTRLQDGSLVRLGPRSRLRVLEGSNGREVWLHGRAYFAVARDERRPFRIHTRAGEAIVLGTRFDLEARDGDLRVVVVEGGVELVAGGKKTKVGARQMGRSTAGAPPVVTPVADVYRLVNWMGDFIAFEETPLADVALEIERRYGIRVDILDSTLARRPVTGWASDRGLNAMLGAACRAVNARCTISDTLIVMEP